MPDSIKIVEPAKTVVKVIAGGPRTGTNFIISEDNPNFTTPGIWFQADPDTGNVTMWIEDGT